MTRDFVFLCASNFSFFFAAYSLLVTLPLYSVALGGEEGQAGFVTAGMTLVSFLALPHLGRYVDLLGRTPMLRLGPALVLAEALALPYVGWFPLLVAISVVCGAAFACFQTGSNTLVADLSPVHRRGEAIGIYGTFTTTSVAISPAAAILVWHSYGYPILFAMSAAVVLAALVTSLAVKETRGRIAASLPGPLLSPPALLPAFGIFALTVTYGALLSFLPGQAPKMGMENAGFFFTAYALSTLLVRALAGGVSDRLGRLPVILPALFALGASMLVLSQSTSQAMVLGTAVLYGLGYGSAHPAIVALAVDRAGPEHRASAVATFYSGYNLGVAAGSLAMGYLLSATSFAVMAVVAGAAPLVAILALYLKGEPRAAGVSTKARWNLHSLERGICRSKNHVIGFQNHLIGYHNHVIWQGRLGAPASCRTPLGRQAIGGRELAAAGRGDRRDAGAPRAGFSCSVAPHRGMGKWYA